MHGEGFLRKKFVIVVVNFLFLLFRKFSVLILQKILYPSLRFWLLQKRVYLVILVSVVGDEKLQSYFNIKLEKSIRSFAILREHNEMTISRVAIYCINYIMCLFLLIIIYALENYKTWDFMNFLLKLYLLKSSQPFHDLVLHF